MVKALEILKGHLKACNEMGIHAEDYKEAIAELEEAMNPKTCDGCTYFFPSHKYWCKFALECSRKYDDRYEPKENKL